MRPYLDDVIARAKTPGLQYVVVDASGTLFDYAGGLADTRGRVPMTSATTMMAYSMTKTITAAAVLRLVDAGAIGLEDPLDKYREGTPRGPGVTIRRLLSHTSGLPAPIPLRWVHLASQHATFDEKAALDRIVHAHPRLSAAPGTKFAYTNLGYWLLGAVIEKASGEAYTNFVEREVLDRLGIPRGQLGFLIADPRRHASGYLAKYSFLNLVKRLFIAPEYIDEYDGSWLRINAHYLNGPAFGGLVGSASGFAPFLQDQLRPESRVLSPGARALFYEQQRTTRGALLPMTLGWHTGESNGERYCFKEGGGGGFHTMMRVYPDRGIASVMMSNATAFDVRGALNTADPHFFR